ncbi:MAG: heme exporter protein CcmB [Bryobacterales bacterium]|nr:heme exporter protein CcmB [Bryobacterales bacterium]MBV9400515.1 heme exporter protein CcmB [Bryobacterales bacterium]
MPALNPQLPAEPHSPSFFRQALTIAAKDLRSELRTKEALNASLAFSVVIFLLFSFAFDPGNLDIDINEFSGGLLWLAFAFAGALSLNRSFARELQNDCLDALVASPAPPGALFLGKALANFALILAVEIISLGVFAVMYNVHIQPQLGWLIVVMLMTTWAITVIGTAFSALTVNLRMRELMLPILTYPFLIPPLMAAILLTTDLLGGKPISADNMIWVRVLVAFDVIFSLLAVVFIDIVLVG